MKKNKIKNWYLNHKKQIKIASIYIGSGFGIALSILGLKKILAVKGFENLSLEELEAFRDRAQNDMNNPSLEDSHRIEMGNLLPFLDTIIHKKKYRNQEIGFPAHSEHGWHLPSDD